MIESSDNFIPLGHETESEEFVWLLPSPPQGGESLSSYVTRLAHENTVSFAVFLPKFLDISHNYDLETRVLNGRIGEKLSEKTGVRIEEISSMNLRKWEDKLPRKTFGTFGTKKSYFLCSHRNGGMHYCPTCLSEDETPYVRQIWNVWFHSACLEHGVILVNKCPHCGKPVDFNKAKWDWGLRYCYSCGGDLAKAQAEEVPRADPNFLALKEIVEILDSEDVVIDNKRFPPWIFFESLHAVTLFLYLGVPWDDELYQQFANLGESDLDKQVKVVNHNRLRGNIPDNPFLTYLITGCAARLLLEAPELLKDVIMRNKKEFKRTCKIWNTSLLNLYFEEAEIKIDTGVAINQAITVLSKEGIPFSYAEVARVAGVNNEWWSKAVYHDLRKRIDSINSEIEAKKKKVVSFVHEIQTKDQMFSVAEIAKETGCSIRLLLEDQEVSKLISSYEVEIERSMGKITEDKVEKAIDALNELGISIGFRTVADRVGCSRETLYRRPSLRSLIESSLSKNARHLITPEMVKDALTRIQEKGTKITVTKVAEEVGCSRKPLSEREDLRKLIPISKGKYHGNSKKVTPGDLYYARDPGEKKKS